MAISVGNITNSGYLDNVRPADNSFSHNNDKVTDRNVVVVTLICTTDEDTAFNPALTCTYGGDSMTKQGDYRYSTNKGENVGYIAMFTLFDAPSGSNTVAFTGTAGLNVRGEASAITVNGVDESTGVIQFTGEAPATAYVVPPFDLTVSSKDADSIAIMGGASSMNGSGYPYSFTNSPSGTEITSFSDNWAGSATANGSVQYVTGNEGMTEYSWGFYTTSNQFTTAMAFLEIAALDLAPIVTTGTGLNNLFQNTATINGHSYNDQGEVATENGVVISESPNPTTADTKVSVGIGTPYNTTIDGLNADTLYYARAFATNVEGTGYGADVSFTTDDDIQPATMVLTNPATFT